jgi:hypothetical protein
MKRYWFLAAFGFAVLAFAAVWMGSLNQDEGWYLYAARLVSEGKTPYRDFFYTQAPVMPIVYSAFVSIWNEFGLLGARIFTMLLGALGIAFFCALAARLVAPGRRAFAALVVFLLLGSNLYHLYYVAIPKTYALASLFVAVGFFLLSFAGERGWKGAVFAAASGVALAFASGTRISLGILLAVVGFGLLAAFRIRRWTFLWFGIGGALALLVVYGFFLADPLSRAGLVAAQMYHAARGGFDPVFTVGAVSRLVRWYVPLFIVLGMGIAFLCARLRKGQPEGGVRGAITLETWLAGAGFLAVFAVQMLAPFPYEDYQVPVIGLLAVFASVLFVTLNPSTPQPTNPPTPQPTTLPLLLVLGLAWATAFGSPLLEKWTTNGQDRFWTLKKDKFELAQLRDVARTIEEEDPNGDMLLTQDLYLAIETGRHVPEGLEMGPFSMLSDERWRELLESAPCKIAALSGYSFAIAPPRCDETDVETQLDYFKILKKNYELLAREEAFGQNATTLLVLKRKAAAK